MRTSLSTLLLILVFCETECRGGGGGRGGTGGGSFGKAVSSSRSYSRPSYSRSTSSYSSQSNSKLANAHSEGNIVAGSSTINQNQNGGNQPNGPPPGYPGLANKPMSNPDAPPAYSPSYSNPPAYSPGSQNRHSYSHGYDNHPSYFNQPSYSHSRSFRPSHSYSYNTHQPNVGYGSTFGSGGLAGNTYISNNYYGTSSKTGGSTFLTNALFFGTGMHMWGSHSSRRSWNRRDDARWRSTTRAPYFENKLPGSESILPASAVVGAATAFGLVSLLPLNVPPQKPLMYCNDSDIAQADIEIDSKRFSCEKGSVVVSCPRNMKIRNCSKKTMQCDVAEDSINLYCTNATLLSRVPIVCNSTVDMNGANPHENMTILHCYEGVLKEKMASSIPTTTVEALVGEIEDLGLSENETAWVAEAMTIPPKISQTSESSYLEWLASLTTKTPPETTTIATTTTTTTTTTTPLPTTEATTTTTTTTTLPTTTSTLPPTTTVLTTTTLPTTTTSTTTAAPTTLPLTTTSPPPTTTAKSTTSTTLPSTTTEEPTKLMIKSWRKLENGTIIETLDEVPDTLAKIYTNTKVELPRYIVKVPITTTTKTQATTTEAILKKFLPRVPSYSITPPTPPKPTTIRTTSTTSASTTTTEQPMKLMMKTWKTLANGTIVETLDDLPDTLAKIFTELNMELPRYIVKVPITKLSKVEEVKTTTKETELEDS